MREEARVCGWIARIEQLKDRMAKLEAKNERLREALEQMVVAADWLESDEGIAACQCVLSANYAIEPVVCEYCVAKAALKEGG